jgi:hypothetical protein
MYCVFIVTAYSYLLSHKIELSTMVANSKEKKYAQKFISRHKIIEIGTKFKEISGSFLN